MTGKLQGWLLASLVAICTCEGAFAEAQFAKMPRLEERDGKYRFALAEQVVGVNAKPAAVGELPWQVALLISADDGIYLCGATVVATGMVVTAAHCVDGVTNWGQVLLISGTIDLDTGGTRAQAQHGEVHPNYNPRNYMNDIAVVFGPLDASSRAAEPATLFVQEAMPAGQLLEVSGWGVTNTGSTSIKLLRASVAYMDNAACNDAFRYDGRISDDMLCAGTETGEDACQGDSGGPLVRIGSDARLVGVVSWGNGCGQLQYPGVYSRVSYFSDWLHKAYADNQRRLAAAAGK